jgi:hypothetical protein
VTGPKIKTWPIPTRSPGTPPARNAGNGTTCVDPVSVVLAIRGVIPSLKNSRSFYQPFGPNRTRRKTISARSPEAVRYMADFALQVPPRAKIAMGSRENLLRVIATAWWPDYRHDADFEIVWDCLQQCGVISNDRWLRQKFLWAEIDKDEPRLELCIEEI